MALVTVNINGKDVQREEVCPGIVKSGNAYHVQCSITKEWMYHSEDRYLKQVAKYGSPEKLGKNLVSQKGKRIQKGEDPNKPSVNKASSSHQSAEAPKDNPWQKPGAWVAPEVRAPGYKGPLSVRQRRDGSMIGDDKEDGN